LSEHPIIQVSTSLRGEGQVVGRFSSEDDIMAADVLLDALHRASIVGKMKSIAESMKDNPSGVELIQRELGGVVVENHSTPQAYTPVATPVPTGPQGSCNQGTRGPHAMACKHCGGPIGERKQLGNFTGHQCLVNNSQCKPTWCN
jgi:hypothetical protein